MQKIQKAINNTNFNLWSQVVPTNLSPKKLTKNQLHTTKE
jgi:predicted ATPase with chaperone activity